MISEQAASSVGESIKGHSAAFRRHVAAAPRSRRARADRVRFKFLISLVAKLGKSLWPEGAAPRQDRLRFAELVLRLFGLKIVRRDAKVSPGGKLETFLGSKDFLALSDSGSSGADEPGKFPLAVALASGCDRRLWCWDLCLGSARDVASWRVDVRVRIPRLQDRAGDG